MSGVYSEPFSLELFINLSESAELGFVSEDIIIITIESPYHIKKTGTGYQSLRLAGSLHQVLFKNDGEFDHSTVNFRL